MSWDPNQSFVQNELRSEKEEPETLPSDTHETDVEDRGPLWKTLQAVEQYELKMIVGIFKFVFWKLPHFIWKTLEDWSPTLAKIAEVFTLFIIWIFIICAPIVYLYYKAYGIDIYGIYNFRAEFLDIIADYSLWTLVWFSLSLIGSLWGILYIKRVTWRWRRRRSETTACLQSSEPEKNHTDDNHSQIVLRTLLASLARRARIGGRFGGTVSTG